MKVLNQILKALDKLKVVIKFVRALDAAIDAFKAIAERETENENKN